MEEERIVCLTSDSHVCRFIVTRKLVSAVGRWLLGEAAARFDTVLGAGQLIVILFEVD